MATLTVQTPGGGIETFVGVNPECMVGAFRAEIGARMGYMGALHLKTPEALSLSTCSRWPWTLHA